MITPEYLRELRADLAIPRYQIRAMDESFHLYDEERLRKLLRGMAIGDPASR